MDAFPKNAEKSADTLRDVLNKLRADGFIDVRYERENLFCLAPLKKPGISEDAPPVKFESGLNKSFTFFAGCCFTLSFLGALIGGIIAGLF